MYQAFVMENAEEVMQSLEEFTKMRPKEIPKELEDYLGYVAKTGDPVYQWSLVKNLFREKLIKVITDFFESTLTVELPACPNVEPFSYDRMKNSLLERFDTFNSAPFTVQRICELLTNPRKEYNRADKYMRAIEKNILVVSTREPGTGKRPLESDSQQETILNGMPDVKVNESDGSLMHVPTDLPYLGAPPASNDVTVETSEPIMVDPVNHRVGFGIDIIEESKTEATDSIKTWVTQEPLDSVVESEQACSTSELLDVEETLIKEKCLEIRDCDADSRFVDLENCPSNSNRPISDIVSESSSNVLVLNDKIGLVVSETPSIDSSDSSLDIKKVHDSSDESVGLNVNDENEVSSTPTDIVTGSLVLEEKIDVPLDSEAEATGSSIEQSVKSVEKLTDLNESEINSSERIIQSNDALSIVTVTEVSGSNTSDETTVECSENEITGTVDSPTSPTSNLSPQSEDIGILDKDGPVIVEECEQPDIHPDSSNDVSSAPLKEITISPIEDSPESDGTVEADSISESYEAQNRNGEPLEGTLDQNNSKSIKCSSPSVQVSSPSLDVSIGNEVEESSVKVLEEIEENVLPTSSIEHIIPNEGVSIGTVQEKDPKLANTLSAPQVAEVGLMYEQEQREESVIQTLPNVPSSLKEIATVEDISVDAGCEAEEEAMDVDDSSNQMMMISEGENEGEPMDQSDQLQS